ncbi:MAG: hypothetical protein ABGX25_06135 [Nautiliaceae bacterium]
MKYKVKGNVLEIIEPIITIKDADEIITVLEKLGSEYDNITVQVKNSFSFPSSIIAKLEKLKDKGKTIKIVVSDDIVYELFKDLNLDKIFHVVKG